MCNLGQAIEDEGIAIGIDEGIKKGTLFTLVSLVKDGLISIDAAASRVNMTEQEFKAEMESSEV